MLFERVEKLRGEPEITFFEIFGILRTVHSGEVEHEIGLSTVSVKLLRSGVDVVFKNLIDSKVWETMIFTLL